VIGFLYFVHLFHGIFFFFMHSFIHLFIMHSVNPYKVDRPMEYRNLSQYKSIIVIKIIKKLHPIYIYNKFYKKKQKVKCINSLLCA